MCLGIAIRRPNDVLAKGIHAGFEWMVIHNQMGYRCGYVKVPPAHPWHGKGYDEVDADVHGGLTFAAPDEACDKGGPDNGHWFGFDCAHAGDAPDPSLPTDRPMAFDIFHQLSAAYERSSMGYSIKTQEYVEAECRSLCEQAAALTGTPRTAPATSAA